ncbi:hypothetical protein SteCoe_34451 [Stentor coeruleus]|uniref:Uncharacterized protein n=1 Tax=Stentor coeruleus TaxID=5963 RepID=A0A1R2AUN9_9CILI|nr:hypothetical protein SteCoe_34451 [Stentor coeruleus]
MSKRSSKIEEENNRLRNELKKLRSELKEIKKNCKNPPVFTTEARRKLAMHIHEKLEQGIFSPPKVPASRSRSPLGNKKVKTSKSPASRVKIQEKFDGDKENCPEDTLGERKSPEFVTITDENFGEKDIIPETQDLSSYLQPEKPLELSSDQIIEQLHTLKRENKLLKELNSLRAENEKLRMQMRNKTPRHKERNNSAYLFCKNHNKSKRSLLEISLNSSVNSMNSKKSAKKILRSKDKSPSRSPKLVSKSNSKHDRTCSPLPEELSMKKSYRKSHNESFSDIFSFTASAKKTSKNQKTQSELSIDRNSGLSKSPSNRSTNRISPNDKSRNKNCDLCDTSLCKGLSTYFCNKHVI